MVPEGQTTVRMDRRLCETLKALAKRRGEPMQATLAKAVEELRRQQMFDEADAAYAALKADPKAWQAILSERDAWDGTTHDGLERSVELVTVFAHDQAESRRRLDGQPESSGRT